MNRLASESSLYLRQHADNPVDWFPWSDEAFEEAHARGVPVLLSIGYSSCHWCHVMAQESFENPDIAALMNELFVNVKVDREERPDVDSLYMQATVALSGNGGWPMTVFLTPGREPFFAGTYFPPESKQGMAGFPEILRAISEAYAGRREEVNNQAEQIAERLQQSAAVQAGESPDDALLESAMIGLARIFDPNNGGFAGAPKFPPSMAVEFLLRRAWRSDDRHAREMAELTLRRMAEGGIYDQLGGGFHRYSVDAVWLIPHFEKMLYDNALLARDYALAYRVTGHQGYIQIAIETLDYIRREMRLDGGAFASAQDADSPEGEGAYFSWTPAQVAEALTEDQAKVAMARWGITEQGNFENNTTVLRVVNSLDAIGQEMGESTPQLLAEARAGLLNARSEREAPARDDKVIASWNGLAIAAFAEAAIATDDDSLAEVGEEAASFVLEQMVVDGRLMRTHQNGEALHLGQLDDYGNMCMGLLRLYEATFSARWFVEAKDLAERMVELFADPEGNGFFYTATDSEELVARTRDLEDQPIPSGNSQAASVLLTLAALTGEADLRERAERAMMLVSKGAERHPQAFGTALMVSDLLTRPMPEVAIVGDLEDPRTKELIKTARQSAGPDAVIAAGDPADADSVTAVPLLRGRALVNDAPAAYVCRNFACQRPVNAPEALKVELES